MISTGNEDPQGHKVRALIWDAQQGDKSSLAELLHLYQNYLNILAVAQFQQRLNPRVSPADLVQESLMRAFKRFGQFRGSTEPELLGWLRKILSNTLATSIEKHLLAARRDRRREVSIERIYSDLKSTETRLAEILQSAGSTPDMRIEREEDSMRLADRLASLPDDYRHILIWRNLQELKFKEIAERLDRSVGATRMLWARAMEKLREAYNDEQ